MNPHDTDPTPSEPAMCVNVAQVAADQKLPAVVRMLAEQLIRETYVNPGPWFKQMSNPDVAVLSLIAQASSVDEYSYTVLLLTALLLGTGEGILGVSKETSVAMGSLTKDLILAESVSRIVPDHARLDHSKITFEDPHADVAQWIVYLDEPPVQPKQDS